MFVFITFVMAVVAVLIAKTAMDRASAASEEAQALRAALDALARKVWSAGVEPAGPAASPPPEAEPEPIREPELEPEPVPEPVAAFETLPEPEPPPPPPITPPPSPPVAPQPIAPPPPPRPPFDWESLIGVKLFSWIAGIALVLAALFFLRYSVEHGWLRPAIRAGIGIGTGALLIAICEMRVARPYKFTANALHGAGI